MKLKPEDILHINVVNWFNYKYPEFKDDLHHFANQRKCSQIEGRLLKRMGVKKGVSDLFLGVPTNDYHGLWVELKTKQGVLSKEQEEFLKRKNERGYLAVVTYGETEAQEAFSKYLSLIL